MYTEKWVVASVKKRKIKNTTKHLIYLIDRKDQTKIYQLLLLKQAAKFYRQIFFLF